MMSSFRFLVFVLILIQSIHYIKSDLIDNYCQCEYTTDTTDSQPTRKRMINGTEASANELNFVVVLFEQYRKKRILGHCESPFIYRSYCTGSIISPSWVITANHCSQVSKPYNANYTIRFFVATRNAYGRFYGSNRKYRRQFIHQNFFLIMEKKRFEVDIALIKLNRPFQLGAQTNIFAVCFSKYYIAEDYYIIAGHGFKDSFLKKGLRNDTGCLGCEDEYFACSTAEYSASCFGDSGGPWLAITDQHKVKKKFFLAGVHSRSRPMFRYGSPCDIGIEQAQKIRDEYLEVIRRLTNSQICMI